MFHRRCPAEAILGGALRWRSYPPGTPGFSVLEAFALLQLLSCEHQSTSGPAARDSDHEYWGIGASDVTIRQISVRGSVRRRKRTTQLPRAARTSPDQDPSNFVDIITSSGLSGSFSEVEASRFRMHDPRIHPREHPTECLTGYPLWKRDAARKLGCKVQAGAVRNRSIDATVPIRKTILSSR